MQVGFKFKEKALNAAASKNVVDKPQKKQQLNQPSPVKVKKPKEFKEKPKKTDAEKLFEQREKMYRQWLLKLNKSNGIEGPL